jgi:hypothetical protein
VRVYARCDNTRWARDAPACGVLYPMNKPQDRALRGLVGHEGGYVRHPSCILETVSSQRCGHFLLFFFRKYPKHLHADVTLLR